MLSPSDKGTSIIMFSPSDKGTSIIHNDLHSKPTLNFHCIKPETNPDIVKKFYWADLIKFSERSVASTDVISNAELQLDYHE